MKRILVSISMMISVMAAGQQTINSSERENPVTVNGYVEGYYSFDFNKPEENNRPGFLYNFNRHNEFNVNLAWIKMTYATPRKRANIAIAAGTYMNANYVSEPGVLKNIYEANVGYKIRQNKNIWLDVGIMPSHIGFETAVGKDNWALTRSMVAENTPYFESGARVGYTTENGKWTIAVLGLNGWQRITRVTGNSLMSWGTQAIFKPSNKVTLNYSTFIGTDKPDSARKWRYHNNVYGIFQFSDKIGVIANFDFGLEQKNRKSGVLNSWFTPVAIMRITPSAKWALAVRGEYFRDADGIIIFTGTPNGFKAFGSSVNIDYLPQENMALRFELRHLKSKDAIFDKDGASKKGNTAITFSTAIAF